MEADEDEQMTRGGEVGAGLSVPLLQLCHVLVNATVSSCLVSEQLGVSAGV